MKRTFCVYASEFASLIGKHPFKNQKKSIQEMVRRIKGEKEPELIVFETKLSKQVQNDLLQECGKHDNIEKVKETITKVKTQIEQIQNITEEEKKDILQVVETKHKTEFGIVQEEPVRQSFERNNNLEIIKDDVFKKRFLFENDKYRFFIGGKNDGITIKDNEKYIIEIKNRQNRLFGYIPEYELIQMYCYFYIYNISKGIFIEKYAGKMKDYNIDFEIDQWNQYVNDIPEFLEIFEKELNTK